MSQNKSSAALDVERGRAAAATDQTAHVWALSALREHCSSTWAAVLLVCVLAMVRLFSTHWDGSAWSAPGNTDWPFCSCRCCLAMVSCHAPLWGTCLGCRPTGPVRCATIAVQLMSHCAAHTAAPAAMQMALLSGMRRHPHMKALLSSLQLALLMKLAAHARLRLPRVRMICCSAPGKSCCH